MKNDLKPYICPQCGGKVNRTTLICEMCGTAFREDPGPAHIVVERPGVHVLCAGRTIDNELIRRVDIKELSEFCIRQLAQEFADVIAPFIVVEAEQDIWRDQTKLRGRLRVVDPEHKF